MATKPETTLPKPLAAYVGLLAASLEDARGDGRSAAAQVAHLPLAAAGQLLTAYRRYDQLAEQGDEIIYLVVGMVRQRFGPGTEEGSEWIGDEFATARGRASAAIAVTTGVAERVTGVINHAGGRVASTVTPLGAARSTATNGQVERPTEEVEDPPSNTLANGGETLEVGGRTLEDAAETLEAAAAATATSETVDVTDTPPAKVAAEKKRPTRPRREEQAGTPSEIGPPTGGRGTAADLPLADFDRMTGPQLRGRLRTLNRAQLVQLLDYEQGHADRSGIVTMLENRLNKLIAAEGHAAG